tara:strand:+ start:2705 stop:3850 length:1146 start_codon:yes stop_codon:yes gene_type:complete
MSSDDNKIKKEGLTNLEFSFKYSVPIESVVSNSSKKLNKNLKELSNIVLNDDQKTILKAYHDLNLLIVKENEIHIHEEVRKLNFLFWIKDKLHNLNFQFIEENLYSEDSHKIITKNYISTAKKNINLLDIKSYKISNFGLYMAIILLNKAYISKGYIYIEKIDKLLYENLRKNLLEFNVDLKKLLINESLSIYRFNTLKDCEKLKTIISEYLLEIPTLNEKFFSKSVISSVTKKLVFDSAHFITDHNGKCKNLHGGRYNIEISIKDRIDPLTGFVIDYSLIKNITKNLVINKFDHKTLNLTCTELAWRSSTEFLAIVIWEILVEYLPSISKIKIFETETSFCEFKGSSLEEFQKNGPSEILNYFKNLSRNDENKKDLNIAG